MSPRPTPAFAAFSLLTLLLGGSGSGLCADDLHGEWRVFRQQVAPWAEPAAAPAAALRIGARVHLGEHTIRGPRPLACSDLKATQLSVPAEGLFQGGLQQPATEAANLGFMPGAVPTLRIDCASGSWDFHAVDAHTLLFALDQRIYSLSRAAGALAAADSPAGRVQSLLEQHFAGDMGFSATAWAPLQPYLGADLRARIDGYAKARWPVDEVPPINGDPLTDSQEYPSRFAVCAGEVNGGSAEVEVRFADAYGHRSVRYLLQQNGGEWQLQDLRFEDGRLFSSLLAERPL